MSLLRLMITGAAVAAGVHYVTKKRPDGTSVMDDIKAKAPEWKEKAQPYVDQLKDRFAKMQTKAYGATATEPASHSTYYDNFSSDTHHTPTT